MYGQYSVAYTRSFQGHQILRRGMNHGPELLEAPESGAEKLNARKEYATSEKLKNWGPAEGIEGPQVTVNNNNNNNILFNEIKTERSIHSAHLSRRAESNMLKLEPGPLGALLCHWA